MLKDISEFHDFVQYLDKAIVFTFIFHVQLAKSTQNYYFATLNFVASSENKIHLNAFYCLYMQNDKDLKKYQLLIQCISH